MSQTTRCPKCNTTFRVSDAQLQVAKGKVRCGSCLNVFKAAEHWVGQPTPAAAPGIKPKPVASKTAVPAGKVAGKFQFDQSVIDGSSADPLLTKPQPAVNTLGEMRAVAAKPAKQEDEDDFLISDDDDDVLISDGADTREQEAAAITSDDDYSDLFLNLDDLGDDGYDSVKDESDGGGDDSWAKDMLEELEDKTAEIEEKKKAVLSASPKDNVFVDDGYVKKRDEPRSGFISGNQAGGDDQALRDLGLDKPPTRKQLNRTEMMSKIEPAPVDMQWQGGARDWAGMLLWGCLTLIAALGLVGQYGWMQFDTLARENTWRPMYAKACSIIGCRLPDQFNPDAIRVSNLVVRVDPEVHYALAVDLILQNTASYAQPFPELELYFSDINDFPVASRRFKPSEYLAGELAGKKDMPSAKSVHISMQVVDPGPSAVNHRLEVSENKPVTY